MKNYYCRNCDKKIDLPGLGQSAHRICYCDIPSRIFAPFSDVVIFHFSLVIDGVKYNYIVDTKKNESVLKSNNTADKILYFWSFNILNYDNDKIIKKTKSIIKANILK